ncbi:SpoIIE family protein phosphatase [Streptomyces kebangsaanensis]|uniref:SpoIIE family protein phosphatase n=1 Tax=Streptomyces kebangsaanensis TaxID=864058 RepID=UPI0009A0F7A8
MGGERAGTGGDREEASAVRPGEVLRRSAGHADPAPSGGLLDLLSVSAVVLDARGRVVFWSPQAQQIFGYSAHEALGRYAARLMVDERHWELVTELFARVMAEGTGWAGAFPIRHKDGSTRLVEFRNVRLEGEDGDFYALGIAADHAALKRAERDLALTSHLFAQSPVGLGIVDTDLRYLVVNPALERINGRPAHRHVGRPVHEVLDFMDPAPVEGALRLVLDSGEPLLDQFAVAPTPADPGGRDHAWSVSYFRLEDSAGQVLGAAVELVDVTEQHRASAEAAEARRRLAMIADASARVGTTLDLETTADELAGSCVPELADLAVVDVLDAVLRGSDRNWTPSGPAAVRTLALAAHAVPALSFPAGHLARYDPEHLVTQCMTTGRPVLAPHLTGEDLARVAPARAAAVLARAGTHSCLAVPLTSRGRVLGALGLARGRNPVPFDDDDAVLALELASRAAVSIDHARYYQNQRQAAEDLQRSLLPQKPPHRPGVDTACRYQPASSICGIGGDWYDVIPLPHDRTALVIGDVMGSGTGAATTMGQLRMATRTLAALEMDPAELLHHLDRITGDLEQQFATCTYAVYDPHRACCRIAAAGHLPPVLLPAGGAPELLDVPTGVPLGVGHVRSRTVRVRVGPGDGLLLYTDGLVETRSHPLDAQLDLLLRLLAGPPRPLEETCDHLLHALRHPDEPDDVALLMARVRSGRGDRGRRS